MTILKEKIRIAISTAWAELWGYRKSALAGIQRIGFKPILLDAKFPLKPKQQPEMSIIDGITPIIQKADGFVALVGGRDKKDQMIDSSTGLLEHEILIAYKFNIPTFTYATINSKLFNRLKKNRQTKSDMDLLSQSEVVKSIVSSEHLEKQIQKDLSSYFIRGDRQRTDLKIEFIQPVHWPTLASNPSELLHCSPRYFEIVIAELLKADGWDVELVIRNNAPGPDIIACSSKIVNELPTKMIVECKRFHMKHPVDISAVRNLVYWVNEEFRATFGMIATTSRFTSEAKRLVDKKHRWRISLKDQNDIYHWIRMQI